MKNIILFKTYNRNNYLYNSYTRMLYYIEDRLYPIIHYLIQGGQQIDLTPSLIKEKYHYDVNEKDIMRVIRKMKIYLRGGDETLFGGDILTEITQEHIKYQISNNPHIVFEVTERCNLQCEYCGYGGLYDWFDPRSGKDLDISSAKSLIKFVFDFCQSEYSSTYRNEIVISFYGGEPLLRFDFVQDIILYAISLETSSIFFTFRMTTNAVFLNKYMNFLEKHKVYLLLSLDGNQYNHSYRRFKKGKESFPIVYENIKHLKLKFSEYFKDYVEFNAVLHNRNSVQEIMSFITETFEKEPSISEITTDGLAEEKKEELLALYQNTNESLHQSEDYYRLLHQEHISAIPEFIDALHFVAYYANPSYPRYDSLFMGKRYQLKPTGTCIPFSKKIYLSATGKILPCENTPHQYYMGTVKKDIVDLNLKEIANQYNNQQRKISNLCVNCYRLPDCRQCMFLLNIEEPKSFCYGYSSKKEFSEYLSSIVSYIENNPEVFKRIIESSSIS